MEIFLESAVNQNHPLRVLENFLENEQALERAKRYDEMRFVGYALDISFDSVKLITADNFKVNVGGIPRNSLLIMVPNNFIKGGKKIPFHFILLRVLESSTTPLSNEVQQTYFELQKKSMPELDVFTRNELQWGALKTAILGMFYPHATELDKIEFSGDINNFVSPHNYEIYSPNEELLFLINNSAVPMQNRFPVGKLRLTECRMPLPNSRLPNVDVFLSTNDFKGTRTAMFGKTRLGKSNVVKLIVQSIIETSEQDRNVGQLIFDINGEYANDNPQDDNYSLRSSYPDRCFVFALTPKEGTPSEPLRLNFYSNPNASKQVINTLIRQAGRSGSDYVDSFLSIDIPNIEDIEAIPNTQFNEKRRAIRTIQYYFALLFKCGFPVDQNSLIRLIPSARETRGFNPAFRQELRQAAYQHFRMDVPPTINNLEQLVIELETIWRFRRENPNHQTLNNNGHATFNENDASILEFLEPQAGRSGFRILLRFRNYHDQNAGDYICRILDLLDSGNVVILDLGNADEVLMKYFSKQLSESVFYNQTEKFTTNRLGNNYIQLYFEEAHNLFGNNDNTEETRIYRRFAKEGAKYHIGMVYSTQSPSTVNADLLAQTENFFIAHLASQDDVNKLAKINIAYDSMKDDILQAKTIGYIRMLTRSHRFVVSLQANRFSPIIR